jgi:two-component system LytT family response regulator
MMIRALLVDDEVSAIHWMLDLLRSEPRIQVVGAVTDFEQAAQRIAENPIDVIFLDIDLRRHNGLDLLEHLDRNTQVVLVTAHEQYAIRGFELGVIDYLLKPVSSERLAVSIQRLFQSRNNINSSPKPDSSTSLSIVTADSVVLIEPETILWIQSENNYSRIYVEQGAPVLLKRTLNEWENVLVAPQFARIGRSLMINLPRVRAITFQQQQEWQLEFHQTTKTLNIGATAARRLRKMMLQAPDPLS